MPNKDLVPRGCGERMIAGLLAILFGLFCSACFFGIRRWTPADSVEQLFKLGVEHVFFSIASICILVAFWAIFAPRWMERIIVRVQARFVTTLLLVILLCGISIFAAFLSE